MEIILPEAIGTFLLVLLGCGVVANAALTGTKGHGGGWLLVTVGWGLGVFAGVSAAASTGAHINPAITLGLWAAGGDLADGIPGTPGNVLLYLAGQFLGAIVAALLCWLAYKQHLDDEPDPAIKLATFATGPAKRSNGWNTITEVIATFVLVFVVIAFGETPADLGPAAMAMLVIGIGAGLGGPTGYAINPARDLGPRLVHAVLPIKGKGSSDWSYSWVPVLGPAIGGVLGGLLATPLVAFLSAS